VVGVTQKRIIYDVERVQREHDGQRVRIITRYEGLYRNIRSPRHVETLREEQARGLRDALDEVLRE
jgi:hypothetical protein